MRALARLVQTVGSRGQFGASGSIGAGPLRCRRSRLPSLSLRRDGCTTNPLPRPPIRPREPPTGFFFTLDRGRTRLGGGSARLPVELVGAQFAGRDVSRLLPALLQRPPHLTEDLGELQVPGEVVHGSCGSGAQRRTAPPQGPGGAQAGPMGRRPASLRHGAGASPEGRAPRPSAGRCTPSIERPRTSARC